MPIVIATTRYVRDEYAKNVTVSITFMINFSKLVSAPVSG
ncbi:hypothetical protein QFZ34_000844 [Phyllobacterium ifriqiyense]|uniref:Uncharacterized protein n=1 Tax=Phyllobacterium ifriqiyense TaxID=314238 RepID=A0ABU0S4I6_9HYPH|nr:hypothetical protein [Phyllobacterium ifriqiyense]